MVATGVGRVDYSQDVQKSVEPITQSWQRTYKDYAAFALNVGDSATFVINIASGFELLLYDFYLSCEPASDIQLDVLYYNTLIGAYQGMLTKSANQHVDAHFEKGFPFIGSYQVVATNLGLAPIDCFYSALGIETLRSQIVLPTSTTEASVSGTWQGALP